MILIVLSLAAGFASLQARPVAGAAMIAAGVLLIVGYFRDASIWLSYRAYQKGDLSRMEGMLAETPNADLLSSRNRAYFDLLRGVSARASDNLTAAREHFAAAASGPFGNGRFRSFAFAQLAEAELADGDIPAARISSKSARDLGASQFVEGLIRDLEHCIEQAESSRNGGPDGAAGARGHDIPTSDSNYG